MAIKTNKEFRRFRIKKRVRKIIKGTPDRPRMSVFRSNKEIYVQLIDDVSGKTLVRSFFDVERFYRKKTIASGKIQTRW